MISSSLLLLATALSVANAQSSSAPATIIAGNPSAETGQNLNKPTKSWQQWQPKPTYAFSDLPDQYMGPARAPPTDTGFTWDQSGYNTCKQGEGQWHTNSTCQTAWLNSVDDFCIWGPPVAGVDVGTFEREAVAYCTKGTHGTRLIPDGTIKSVHFVRTRDYIQVTGSGDFTSIGMIEGDSGGEMDPHGMDDLSNPIGGILYTTAHPESQGKPYFIREWTNFMSWNQFCLRACWGERAARQCEHKYDIMGCAFNIPANYGDGFESCDGDIAQLQGIYGSSTFNQGDAQTPAPHPAPSSSNCQQASSISNGLLLVQNGQVVDAKASPTTSSESVSSTGTGMRTVGGGSSSTARNDAASPSGSSANQSGSGSSGANTVAVQGPLMYAVAGVVAVVAGGAFVL
ncbi:unnamed protein product [Sympodiomycopsis kandeliae]